MNLQRSQFEENIISLTSKSEIYVKLIYDFFKNSMKWDLQSQKLSKQKVQIKGARSGKTPLMPKIENTGKGGENSKAKRQMGIAYHGIKGVESLYRLHKTNPMFEKKH